MVYIWGGELIKTLGSLSPQAPSTALPMQPNVQKTIPSYLPLFRIGAI